MKPSVPSFPAPALIADSAALAALCDRLRAEPFVTVDTEFMRESTYYPQLCVVQLAGESEVAVIDARAPGIDLAPLGALLAAPEVLKVFHAARQDLEIFLHLFGRVPSPIHDTQVAAMVAGFGDQIGYDALVQSLTGGEIDKAHRFSDWSARPLSRAQIDYASADVTYLRGVHRKLHAKLEREGRAEWVRQEMAALADPATYVADPETQWERLRPRTGNRRVLGTLRAVAAWREREARRIDIPRQRLLKDESLMELAAAAPRDPAELGRVRGIARGFAEGRVGAELLAVVAEAQALPEAALPAPRGRDAPRPSPALVSLLKVLLAAKCEQHGVAARLVASGEDLDQLAAEPSGADVPALHGWRREVFGEDALALAQGRLVLGVEGRRVKPRPA